MSPLLVTRSETLSAAVRDLSKPVTRFFERQSLGPFGHAYTIQVGRGPLELDD